MIIIIEQQETNEQLLITVEILLQGQPFRTVIGVPFEAIVNRMAFYGLATEGEALDAILREHYHRLNGKDQRAPMRQVNIGSRTVERPTPWGQIELAERRIITGGLDDTVKIKHRQP